MSYYHHTHCFMAKSLVNQEKYLNFAIVMKR